MVNIIPKVPGFGERLGAAIGGGLGGGFQQGMSKAQEFAEKIKLKRAEKNIESQSFSHENEIIKDKYGIDLSDISDPKTRQALLKHEMQGVQEKRDKEIASEGIKSQIDWLDKNIGISGKPGLPVAMGGPESHKGGGLAQIDPETGKKMSNIQIQAKREEIKKSGIWMADAIYTHFNKGVLNKEKWDDVKNEFAVDPDLPPEVNRARMAAAKRIMALPKDIPSSVANKVIGAQRKSLEKIEKSKGVKQKELPPLESFYE
jgi:hypothetical protein